MKTTNQYPQNDVAVIGGGIMSATLATIIKELMPDAKITIYEQLDKVAAESSDSWNNAGTGHAAFCELNYTPEQPDGSINIEKALNIGSAFEVSKLFWAYLQEKGYLNLKHSFIKAVPHMSFVWGEDNISFLKRRHEAITKYALFEDMKYSEDHEEIRNWIPLMMKNRNGDERIGVTRMAIGTDVNFDALTKGMIENLKSREGVEVKLSHSVKNLTKQKDGSWKLKIRNREEGKTIVSNAKFVFIGAGGGALHMLQKSGIKEGKGYGGFPVSGMFMRCKNPEVISQHEAKVYGKAAEGSPPMSMPHMDERKIEGERSLMFGPYAGFSTKFLKTGSYWDLFGSLRWNNIKPMMMAGWHNLGLIKYLMNQAMQSKKARFKTLKKYFPEARMEEWELFVAGQRVQIMKKDKKKGGVLKLGTEMIVSEDRSIAALLGASPGASTAVTTMFDMLDKCYPEEMKSKAWLDKLQEMVPSYGKSLIDDNDLCRDMRKRSTNILELEEK